MSHYQPHYLLGYLKIGIVTFLTGYISIQEMSRNMTKPTKWLCAQRRHRSAWASAQSYQSLRCAHNGYLRTQAFFTRTAKTLIRLGGCPVWSESSLGAQSLCWFCHKTAQIAGVYLLIYCGSDYVGKQLNKTPWHKSAQANVQQQISNYCVGNTNRCQLM